MLQYNTCSAYVPLTGETDDPLLLSTLIQEIRQLKHDFENPLVVCRCCIEILYISLLSLVCMIYSYLYFLIDNDSAVIVQDF